MRSPFSSFGTGVGSSGTRLSLARSRLLDDRQHLPHGTVQVFVHDHVVEMGCELHLALRDEMTSGLVGSAFAVPLGAAPLQLVHRWRSEEYAQCLGRTLSHLLGTLDVDLEDHIVAGLPHLVELRDGCAIQIAVVGGVL